MIHTRTRVAAAMAALCLVGPLAGCTSSGNTATSVASSAAPTASTPVSAATASPVADASGAGTSATPPGRSPVPSYTGPAVSLTIGTDDSPGVPSADEISHFADAVKSSSGGKITIEPKWHADGDGHLDWDQQVAALVQNGKLDLALGPTWAWDVLNVKSFEPLQSPFLIDSDPLVAAVITDQHLSAQLMSGMPAAGVTGMALWPEGLRHPFGFDKPLLTPADFKGQTVRSAKSATIAKVFAALGAKTSSEEPDATTMVGSQSEYVLGPNGIGLANVTFFPKVNVLYANSDRYATLDDGAKAVLATAAADTQQWSIDRTSDVAAGKDFCDGLHTLVLASKDEVADLTEATQPVADAIKAAHPEAIGAIQGLKETLPSAEHANECAAAASTATTHAPGPAEAALNGTYRFTLTKEEFQQAGLDSDTEYKNAGIQTFTLEDGAVHYRLDPSEREFSPVAGAGGSPDEGDGTYQVDGATITFRWPSYENEVDHFTVTVTPERDLELKFLDSNSGPDIEFFMASKLWERIA